MTKHEKTPTIADMMLSAKSSADCQAVVTEIGRQIHEAKGSASSLESSLSSVVLNGGDINEARQKLENLEKTLWILEGAKQSAMSRLEQAQEDEKRQELEALAKKASEELLPSLNADWGELYEALSALSVVVDRISERKWDLLRINERLQDGRLAGRKVNIEMGKQDTAIAIEPKLAEILAAEPKLNDSWDAQKTSQAWSQFYSSRAREYAHHDPFRRMGKRVIEKIAPLVDYRLE